MRLPALRGSCIYATKIFKGTRMLKTGCQKIEMQVQQGGHLVGKLTVELRHRGNPARQPSRPQPAGPITASLRAATSAAASPAGPSSAAYQSVGHTSPTHSSPATFASSAHGTRCIQPCSHADPSHAVFSWIPAQLGEDADVLEEEEALLACCASSTLLVGRGSGFSRRERGTNTMS